jgi:anti-sigma B factor antagonist
MTTLAKGAKSMASVHDVGRLEVRPWPDRDRVVLAVSGELDIASVGALQDQLNELHLAGWNDVVLDLRELTFIDSCGLSLLLREERAARRAGASFAIVDGSPPLARMLEIVGLEDHFSRACLR